MSQLAKLRIDREPEVGRSSGRLRRILTVVFLCALPIAGYALYRGPLHPAPKVELTTATTVYPSQANSVLNASGYVVAQRKAEVASKATGRLVWLGVEEGTVVRKGQVLARVESQDMEAALAQAKAQLQQAEAARVQAEAEFHRQEALVKAKFVSHSDYDLAESKYRGAVANVSAAEAMVEAAEVNLENTYIRAPFDGTVLTKDADVGDVVAPFGSAGNSKGAVVSMADMDSLQVEADVSESNIERVHVGQPCEITVDALPEKRYRGEVHMIVPTADRAKATVMTKIKFLDRDDRVLPEMSARVTFLSRQVATSGADSAPKIAANPGAVVERNGRKEVYIFRDGKVYETPVVVGGMVGTVVAISHGVRSGDQLVMNPPEGLQTGTRVRPIE